MNLFKEIENTLSLFVSMLAILVAAAFLGILGLLINPYLGLGIFLTIFILGFIGIIKTIFTQPSSPLPQ